MFGFAALDHRAARAVGNPNGRGLSNASRCRYSEFVRHLLITVLVLVLPLKAVAASVVPIVGVPEHAHVPAHAQLAAHATIGHAHDDCGARAAQVPASADTLHEHACPHLAMASVAPVAATFEAEYGAPRAPSALIAHFVSVVLDVPSLPPITRA